MQLSRYKSRVYIYALMSTARMRATRTASRTTRELLIGDDKY